MKPEFVTKKNNKRHRHEGPAVIWGINVGYFDYYYVNGNRHRIDGPAIIWGDGEVAYYVNGLGYEKYLFEIKYKPCVLKDGVLL